MNEKKVYSYEWAGRPLVIEVGQLAKQANGAALVRYGDTSVLATATMSKSPKPLDFFPLTVNYEERLYAAGKIPGGFIKREGRPSEKAILASRLIDRPIRPMFPDGFRNEVQVISMVMSNDPDCTSEMAAMVGSSLALSISDIPFDGPIAGVQVGYIDGEFIVNPTVEQSNHSTIHLSVAGNKDAINMVEAGALEVPEEIMLEAIMFGHEEIKKIIAFQEQIVAEVGKEKLPVTLFEIDEAIQADIKAACETDMHDAIQTAEKHARDEAIQAVKDRVIASYEEQEADDETMKQVYNILDKMVKEEVRRQITEDKIRPDGRKLDEIRPLSSETGLLQRTHGSGLFTRGQTQALSICTLGALGDVQIIDGLGVEESKRFMHHYNFPQFSVGETGPIRGPGRREIGHGALGERALEAVIPDESAFPYTIRCVSEVLESNGSTSQASICASTLAMMDAGVPLKAPVAGIAMGLIKKGEHYSILTDIQGMEDHLGDMDFKVAGTAKGVTALQMDIKIDGLSRNILEEALTQAKVGRMHILESMLATLAEPREKLSEFAPKIVIVKINPDKIRDVIGPGGKQINKIIEETGVKIDTEQDGTIYISSANEEMNARAKQIIEDIVREAKVGEYYLSTVKRIEKFGAFCEIFPGKDGLLHISEIQEERTKQVEDVLKLGDQLLVKVIEIDKQGRVNLSRKVVIQEEKERAEQEK
ncbi:MULTISPECIES: polyribonucleotide nucleotidyltransferase [Lysinibacillus]|uniref:Polyribonucleotide nucleotidyltransferase n=1 Tax=Lysinibacillus fusiformis TaxID=28031 RepID=A0A2I0V4K4_9BACI|nr:MULTISPECIES: polyribonucleotide nucleotidyltransferase [Lysinibacillus]KUF28822.1 polyribonucleotide nucleotidyltransferase [Lysinibacillus sp. F5]PKU53226.1 polyribonucleotide nucleotidyltransferase [Lysinibacillus fusiformis]SCX85739.1 polyribonucleotide nucleotidyltransferase [Lysinibacillus sp. SG9]SDB05013.1 polyribonucleotide nucleotidyltransferase [Lysinibacillus sp. TC-37]SFS34767.1 polyribonucleotide nucleotidyltransferase [Lysinibacillus sp. SG55]